MRPLPADLYEKLFVDLFAGGGGASHGIERARKRAVDLAINHCPEAIFMHARNHPHTAHLEEDVWKVDPRTATGGRRIGGMWASPDCTHFSRAKGAKPVSSRRRSLAWVVVKWAKVETPDIIFMENVREFQEWGPLGADHRPIKSRLGEIFRRWVGALRKLGYVVEWRVLNAADYGAPTHRRRLFIIARRDGNPIVWPPPEYGATHGHVATGKVEDPDRHVRQGPRKNIPGSVGRVGKRGRRDLQAGAAFSERGPGPVGREPLGQPRPALRPYRTAAECIDWSLPCPSIFLTKEEGRAIGVKRPLADATLRRIAKGIRRFVIEAPGGDPFIVPLTHTGPNADSRTASIRQPLPTITTAKGGEFALCMPFIKQAYGGMVGKPVTDPLPAVTSRDHNWLVAPTLVQSGYGERKGQEPRALDLNKPLGTVVAGGCKHALASAFMTKFYGTAVGSDMREPVPTITADGTHLAQVRAFLVKYYGQGVGQAVSEPLHTVTTKERFGLVQVWGEWWQIVDIGLRMLTPRELARAQGFPEDYILTGTKTSQIARIGNSVCPVMAEALVRANYPTTDEERRAAA